MTQRMTAEPWAVFHDEDGQHLGGAVLSHAPKACGEPDTYNRLRHVFVGGSDGVVCLCGRFRRRVFDRCPTCRAPHYSTVERA